MVRVDFMKTFIEVVQSGSLKKAAKSLGMSVSSVSFQINSVESFYGAKLLERRTDGVRLTDEGNIAFKNMKNVLSSIEETKKLISNLRGDKITIASGMVGINVVHAIQTLLKASYPQLEVNVALRGAHECVKGILNGKFDFAIAGDLLDEHLEIERLGYEVLGIDHLVLIVPPNHDLVSKSVVTLEDITKYPIVMLTDDYGITTSTKKALMDSGLKFDRLNIAYTVGDFYSKINAVSGGMGIAITSYIAACRACEVGLIKMRKIQGFKSERKIFLVYSKLSTESKKMKEYLDFILEKGRQLFQDFARQCSCFD
ncbi:LysR family transcriptional regulator [Archaeoglobus neptunius]|uniref:LysR family transcriptional regulator n=1 Tax=Archaeoglobus neptunius TaxID=2798580 RepID=UPI001926F8EE|nr:LysR family transcriptional regulator [Archaeoglobus neptunius]